jgi:MinD superfamily P-loop ATPase
MAFKIAVASGKGGTGKTTVAVNLYNIIQSEWTKNVLLVDCDVEEPNDLIFFPGAVKFSEKEAKQLIPEINLTQCTFCRKCSEYCEFNAIVVIPPAEFAEVNKSLCHSCGACFVACQENAIHETWLPMGTISAFNAGAGNGLLEGSLKIGSAMQTMLIGELKKNVSEQENEVVIYDAPPGTSCPVVETVADADYILLVTEPTPFGLYDLTLTVEMLEKMDKKFGVIVNKAGLGNNDVYQYLKDKSILLMGEIPFNKEYAETYASANLLDYIPKEFYIQYANIVNKLKEMVSA